MALKYGAKLAEGLKGDNTEPGTPALLIGVSLAEAVGERRSQNIPGTTTEYPNWCVPLCGPDGSPVPLEDLQSSDRVRTIARAAAGG